jgi:hypothetical protein
VLAQRVIVSVCVLALVAGAAAAPARAAPGLLVGVDDDTAKWQGRSRGLVATYRDLGLDRVRVTIPWKLGRTKPTRIVGRYLHRVAGMIVQGQQVVLAIYGRAKQAPVDSTGRAQYCGFAAHVLARLPVHEVVIWNEANSPEYWPQAAGAPAYEALLATCWDQLHRLHRGIRVISSTAVHWDPAGFIRRLGEAYRASGRSRPILDLFGHNPYPDFAAEPPSTRHADPATVGEGDLERLQSAIDEAFSGTDQPVPTIGRPLIWYLEDGFQTRVPAAERSHYRGVESDPSVLPPLSSGAGAQGASLDQATQLRNALLLAYCQPDVGAFFNFELIDEDRLSGWQSGLLWRGGDRKGSYNAFREVVAQVKAGQVSCAAVPGAPDGDATESGGSLALRALLSQRPAAR